MNIGVEDLRLLDGGRGNEVEVGCHEESPTWVVDEAWERAQEVCRNALAAYMLFCGRRQIPHSVLLGLDVLIMGEVDPDDPRHIVDIRPTMVEGPCCNSYPACPNVDSYKLYRRAQRRGFRPEKVEYPTDPTRIRERIAQLFKDLWNRDGRSGLPRVGVFTRPYEESEEETAHNLILEGFRQAGLEAYRVTPEERPEVKNGQLHVGGVPIDMVYRRIERIHVRPFYGQKLGSAIIEACPKTRFLNPWQVDDLRSKTVEERVFRAWEQETGDRISRPATLLGSEITSAAVGALARRGGFVTKRWNSTGGKGVFMHVNMPLARQVCDFLYGHYDGRHMMLLDAEGLKTELARFDGFDEDTALQQMRFVDARRTGKDERLVYDTRINVLYNAARNDWDFLSGISRSVSCGPGVSSGNSLLTNISSGAEVSPLIMGRSLDPAHKEQMNFGPLLSALMNGQTDLRF